MKIRLKWILTGAVALVAAIVAAGYAVLASFESEDLRAVIESEAKSATGRSLTIGGPMDLDVSFTPTIAIENVTFGNAPWGVWPEIFSIRRLEVQVALLPLLSGEVEVRRLLAIEPVILLETNAEGQGNWVLEGGETEADETEPSEADVAGIPAFHRIEIQGGRAIFRDGESGEEILVNIGSLEGWADTPASPSNVALNGSYNGVEISASGTLGSRDELLTGGRLPLDLELVLGSTSLELSGEIAELAAGRGVALDIDMRGRSVADLGPLVGEELPPLGPYTLAGRLSDTENGLKLAGLALTLGNSDLAGNAALDLSGARPAITATMDATALELQDLIGRESEAAAGSGQASEQGATPQRVFSDEPLPLDALQAFDARIKLSADQARLEEKTMVSDLEIDAELKAGRLTVHGFNAGFSGGTVAGTFTLDTVAAGPPLSLELTAKGFDYGHFLQGRDITDGVDGKLDGDIKLDAAGTSLHGWAQSANGSVSLVGGTGRVRSDLLQAGGVGLIDMVSGWREGDNDLKLNCVVMRLPVENGVMEAEAVLIDTAAVTVGVTGDVNLGEEALDLKVTPQAKRSSLMSLAVPVRLGGTLSDPEVVPDPVGTAFGAAKIAGLFINPLAAGALIIMESELSDQNPCVAAIEGKATSRDAPPSAAPKTQGQPSEKSVLEDLEEGVSRGLKDLFND